MLLYIILILIITILFINKNKWKYKYNSIYITSIPITLYQVNDKIPDEEKFKYINAKDIIIRNDDECFYNTLNKKRDIYEKIVYESQKFKNMIAAGRTIESIMMDDKYYESATACFNKNNAIVGWMEDNKVYLSDGRHRCAIAKELGLEVPVYITMVTVKVKLERNKIEGYL